VTKWGSGEVWTRVDGFEDLEIWQAGRELVMGVYRASASQALGRDYAMCNQMKRAVIGIPSNIAEGYERGSRKQQIEFCYMAKGSVGELRTQVILAHDVGLLDDTAHKWLLERCDKLARRLARYLSHLKTTCETIPGAKYVKHERHANRRRVSSGGPPAQDGAHEGRPCDVPASPRPHVPTSPRPHSRPSPHPNQRGNHGTL
jgi:four helix bundle protein